MCALHCDDSQFSRTLAHQKPVWHPENRCGALRGSRAACYHPTRKASSRLNARDFSICTICTYIIGGCQALDRGFDESYGIPRSYNEVSWPSLNATHFLWPSVGAKQGWDPNLVPAEPIYEARKGEKPRKLAKLDLDRRRAMEKEITLIALW